MSTISTPSSGSEYTSSSASALPEVSLPFPFKSTSRFKEGAGVLDRLAPNEEPDPGEGAREGAKLDRGTERRALFPANAGPIANGPLAVISTSGLGGPPRPLPLPLPSPRPRPRPRSDAEAAGTV